jgi:FkbM family methyltransferase
MLLKLSELIEKHKLSIRGAIVVGAHELHEEKEYSEAAVNKLVLIEPASKAFNVLRQKFSDNPDITLFNCACGSVPGSFEMFVETRNGGQSSSLLEPALHTVYYSDIVFDKRETVEVKKLDNLDFDRSQYNFISVDCQGFERYVFEGGIETLKHIDYIMTEVNTKPLYQGCVMYDDLKKILKDFEVVEEHIYHDKGWGDVFMIRRSKRLEEPVPEKFRPMQRRPYPSYSSRTFEEYVYDNYYGISGRVYLPILWTHYYCVNDYGRDKKAIAELQEFLDGLDRSKSYFSVYQFDSGVMNDVSHLDIKFFAPCGNRVDVPIPLLCEDSGMKFDCERDLLGSFIGRRTHPVRDTILEKLSGEKGYYVTDQNHGPKLYHGALARSIFAISARGYGLNSFRLTEGVRQGAIPVWVSDVFYDFYGVPFDSYGIKIKLEDAHRIGDILSSFSDSDIALLQKGVSEVRDKFSYEYALSYVMENKDK